jgi:hypothetical protein
MSNNKVYIWDWEKTKTPKKPFPNNFYSDKADEFKELSHCNKIIEIKK